MQRAGRGRGRFRHRRFGRGERSGRGAVQDHLFVLAQGAHAARQAGGAAAAAAGEGEGGLEVCRRAVLRPQRAQGEGAGAHKEGAGQIGRHFGGGDALPHAARDLFPREGIQVVVVLARAAGKVVQRPFRRGEAFARGRQHARAQKVAGIGGIGVGRVLPEGEGVFAQIGGDLPLRDGKQRPRDAAVRGAGREALPRGKILPREAGERGIGQEGADTARAREGGTAQQVEQYALGVVPRVVGGGDDVRLPRRQQAGKGGIAAAAGGLLEPRLPRRRAGGDILAHFAQRHAARGAERAHKAGVRAGRLAADAVFDVDGGQFDAVFARASA